LPSLLCVNGIISLFYLYTYKKVKEQCKLKTILRWVRNFFPKPNVRFISLPNEETRLLKNPKYNSAVYIISKKIENPGFRSEIFNDHTMSTYRNAFFHCVKKEWISVFHSDEKHFLFYETHEGQVWKQNKTSIGFWEKITYLL